MNTNISVLLNDMNTYNRNIIKNMAARPSHLLRTALMLLLLLVGGMMNGAWATIGDEHVYTYHVVNDRGVVAVFGTIKQNSGSAPALPDAMKSPLVDDGDYKFYLLDGATVTQDRTQGRTSWTWSDNHTWHYTGRNEADYAPVGKFTFSAEAVPMTTLPDNDANIYVRYPKYTSPKTVNGTTFDLSGNTLYNIQYGSQYLKYGIDNLQTPTESEKKDKEYLWAFTGNDPYDIEIRCLSDLSKKLALNLSQSNSGHESGNEKKQNFATDTDSENYLVRSFFLASGNTAGTFEITATDVSGIERDGYAPRYLYFTTNNYGTQSMFRSFWGDTQDANGIKFVHGGDMLKATITANTANVKYHLVNLGDNSMGITNRKEILTATTTVRTIDIPSELSSPVLNASDYSYYTADAFTSTSGSAAFQLKSTLPEGSVLTPGDAIPTNLLDIYVLYSYSASTHTIKLDGSKATFVKINNMHLRARDNITGNGGGGNDRTDLNAGILDVTLNNDEHYHWLLIGNDPYNMRLCSKFYGTDYYVVCKDGNTHIIKDGSVSDSDIRIKSWAIMGSTAADLTNGQYELMGIKPDGTPYYNGTNLQYLAKSGSYPAYVTKSNAGTVQTDLIQFSTSVTYHVVNLGDNGGGLKNREVAITALSTTGTVGIPDVIRSPIVNSYNYYLPAAFATTTGENAFQSPNNSYKLTENASLSNDVTDIYVLYDYVDGEEVNGQHIWLNGATNYKIKMGDTNGYITRRTNSDNRPDYNTTDSDDDNYLWTLSGQDPYNISIRSRYRLSGENEDSYLWAANKENNMYVSTNTTNAKITKYMLLDHPTANYSLMAVYDNTQQPNSSGRYLFLGSRQGSTYPSIEYMLPTLSPQVTLIRPTITTYIYHIVNKAGNVALSKAVGSTLTTLEVPTDLMTPYIPTLSNYRFFGSQADAAAYSANPTATNAAKAITEANEANADIYIGYNYDGTVPEGLPVLDGSIWYQMRANGNTFWKGVWNSTLGNTSPDKDTTGGTTDEYLWKFTGDDPYAVYVSNKWINLQKANGADAELFRSGWNNGGYFHANYATGSPHGGTPHMILTAGVNDGSGNPYYNLTITHSNGPSLDNNNYYVLSTNVKGYQSDAPYPRYHNPNNKALLQFISVAMGKFRFHLTKKVSGEELTVDVEADYATGNNLVTLPESLRRRFASSDGMFYKEDTHETTYTSYRDFWQNGTHHGTGSDEYVDIYADYTVSAPFTFSTAYDDATWYQMVFYDSKYAYNNGTTINFSNAGSYALNYQFAFTGDPYDVKIWSRSASDAAKYVGVPVGTTAQTTASMVTAADKSTWEMVSVSGVSLSDNEFLLRALGETGWYFAMPLGSSAPAYTTSTSRMHLQELPNYSYTYNIVDNKGNIAIKYTVDEMVTKSLDSDYTYIPEAIRSPYLEGETVTFYDAFDPVAGLSSLEGHAITETPSTNNANIYVRYTNTHLMSKNLHLRGVRGFQMQVYGDGYVYDNSGTLTYKASPTESELNGKNYMWHFGRQDDEDGPDPYAVQVKNVQTGNRMKYDTSTGTVTLDDSDETNTRFIIMMNGGTMDNPQVELVAATGADIGGASYYAMGRNDGAVQVFAGTGDYVVKENKPRVLIRLSVGQFDVTYSIVARDGRIVVKDIENTSDAAPSLPTEWRSPLATNYRYWQPTQFTVTGSGDDAKYTNPTGSEVLSVSEAISGVIFVTYDVDESKGIDLDGSDNRETDGKYYLLKFAGGTSFRQEKSDGFEDTAQPGIYPYNNGEAGLFVYGQDRLDAQANEAASTRTRWAWYIEGGDPYRLKLVSMQTNMDGSKKDDHYAYLYTYKPDDYSSVVTSIIVPAQTDVEAAGITGTEYMVLQGTNGHMKLVTTNPISDGSTNQRRTVTSFENYWKTNPTAINVIKEANSSYTGGTPTDAQKQTYLVDGQGWHSYSAWAYGTTWTSSSKTFGKEEHWFRTIQVGTLDGNGQGNGDFDFEEKEIDGALILLDQHGWEIMRKPIAKTGHSQKDTRDAAIRVYDSPMVKTYHFWTKYKKEDGYHKYKPTTDASKISNNTKHQKAGTSLAQYPEVSINGTLEDIYVTYEVKDAYAQSYTGAATKSGTSSTSFYVRQGGATTYAKATSATTLATETVADILNANDDVLLWKLHPNFDIDAEMGYRYKGDSQQHYEELTQAQTEAAYLANTEVKDYTTETPTIIYTVTYGQNAFDPYNMQLESVAHPGKFFTTNASKVIIDGSGSLTSDGMSSSITLTDGTTTVDATDYYDIGTGYQIIHSTNTTFMVTDDGNGNMRLMPRFDHGMRATSVTTLTANTAAVAADDDCSLSPQTVLFQQARVFTYIVIDNQGREALRFTSSGDVDPKMKQRFISPLATNFTFYTSADNATEGTNAFTTLIGTTLIDNKVYVRYDYDYAADTQGLLKGTWVTTKINSTDVQYSSGIKSVSPKSSTTAAQQWRLLQRSSGEQFDPDPYAVSLYNASLKGGSPEAMTPINVNSNDRFVILNHPSAATGDYALLVAGTGDHNYAFLNGSNLTSGATTAVVSTYATDGTLTNAEQVVFTADVIPEGTITYKIITNTGKVALTGTYTIESGKYTPSLPTRMRSPIMEDNESTYLYYTARNADGTVNTMSQTTTMRNLDDDHVLYVHYDYEKSKSVFKDFVANNDQVNFNYATLDLSGKVPYALAVGSGNWLNNNGPVDAYDDSNNEYQYRLLRFKNYSWYLLGEDPYEVTMVSLQDSKVFGVKKPSVAGEVGGEQATACSPDDDAYYKTFMILKGLSNTNNQYYSLNLYATGEDKLFIGRSGNAAYSYLDTQGYVERTNSVGRRSNHEGSYAYQRFWFRPNLIYSVITNDGKEAIWANSIKAYDVNEKQYNVTTFGIPQYIQSPLLNKSDFVYYSKRPTWDDEEGKLVTDETSLIDISKIKTIADAAEARIGTVYVRYTYNRETSPYKIASAFNVNAADGTHLDWTGATGLDLSGNTWYNMANMRRDWSSAYGYAYGVNTTNPSSFERSAVNTLGNNNGFSGKSYLWKLVGDDPYAIRIYSCQYNDKCLSIRDLTNDQWHSNSVQNYGASGYSCQTFMLLNLCAGPTTPGAAAYSGYKMNRWPMLVATGAPMDNGGYVTLSTTHNESSARWYPNAVVTGDIRIGTGETEQRILTQMWGLNSGAEVFFDVEFVRAPVARKYRYHAIKYEGTTKKGETWTATLEHDWLMPVVLEDDITRLYTKYEKKNTTATGDDVTGTNDFDTRAVLEALNNAQFYSDAALSKRIYAEDETTHEKTYDVYPAIGTDEVCDIYFKYQAMTNAEIRGTYSEEDFKQQVLPFQWTENASDIADDVELYNKTDVQKTTIGFSGQDDNIKANWYYMVLDTDEGITATGAAGTSNRTFTGNQNFLRREDGGMVSWLNSNKTLHKNREDNYNNYSYNRLAESIRYNDHEPFREARWLWAFTGDPYDMKIINMESALGVLSDPGDSDYLEGKANCYTLTGEVVSTDDKGNDIVTWPVVIPTDEPTGEDLANSHWGLASGYGSEATFSLLSTVQTQEVDGKDVNQLRYWQMKDGTVSLQPRASQRENAIQLLPYEPCIYEDVRIIIRRDDEVKDYKEVKYTTPLVSSTDKENQLSYLSGNEVTGKGQMKTGLSRMYFSAEDRMFVAGEDYIRGGVDGSTLPADVRRKFCNYKIYSDDYRKLGDYAIVKGPYRGPQKTKTENGIIVPQFDYDGKPIYQYYEWKTNLDGTPNYNEYDPTKPTEPQTVFVEYKVTSDMFLTEDVFDKFSTDEAKKAEVARMANENDHVYFIDFPLDESSMGYDYGAHAYFEQNLTFEDLLPDKDLAAGTRVWEKTYWNGTEEVEDQRTQADGVEHKYNDCEFRVTSWDTQKHTGSSRMESTPENLKWYFVGDPYNVQVFSTHPDRFGYNLCPFDETESAFRAVIDCVHLRQPDNSTRDTRLTVQPVDENNNPVGDPVVNPSYGRLFYGPFYWEMVDAASDVEGTFALRYRSTNKLLQQEGVYRYLVDGKSKVYPGFQGAFTVNIEYDNHNTLQGGTGKYADFHTANDEHAIIRLVQPAKVYVSSYNKGDTTPKTTDELSEYFGLGETLTDMPRHLKRRYVKYDNWRYLTSEAALSTEGTSTSLPLQLTADKAWKLEDCGESDHAYGTSFGHPYYDQVFVDGTKKNATFRLKVEYELDDLVKKTGSEEYVHLFTDPATIGADYSKSTWLDVQLWDHGGYYGWLFYDKTNDQPKTVGNTPNVTIDADHTKVTVYTANNGYTGWNTGLKGLHWAFVGDPYDFTVLSRRKYDDGETAKQWLDVKTLTAEEKTAIGITTPADSVVTVLNLQDGTGQQHFGLIYYKMSPQTDNSKIDGNNQYFLRTASLKTTELDYGNEFTEDNKYPGTPNTGDDASTAYNHTNAFQKVMLLRVPSNGNIAPEGNFFVNDFLLSSKFDNTNTKWPDDIHRAVIMTAVVEDEDQGLNDCFDANVYVYHRSSADVKAKLEKCEVRYTAKNADGTMKVSTVDVMPFTLKRLSCDYTCWVNYDPATGMGTEVKEFVKTADGQMAAKDASGNTVTITSKTDGLPNICYTYTYDDIAQYFTQPDDATHDDYTWSNAYFNWQTTRKGNTVETGSVKWGIIGYKYDIEGNVIGLEYGWVADTETSHGSVTTVYYQGWMNSHTSGNSAYGDDNDQREENDQKWAFVGDPYDFQLKNYEQYLQNASSTLTSDNDGIEFSLTGDTHWALALGDEVTDPDGTKRRECYLAIIDEYGNIVNYVTFDREANNRILPSDNQNLYTKGGPVQYDPTGNRYDRQGVKAFNISDLLKYAQYVIYHLVTAHQHSADYQDTGLTAEQKIKVRRHLAEYIKHHDEDLGGKTNLQQYIVTGQGTFTYTRDDNTVGTDGTTYITDDFDPAYISDGKLNLSAISNDDDLAEIKTLLSKGSLRDLISYPVENFRMQRVAVGNKLTVPWYMRRQFCTYDLVQRDVLRSEFDPTDQAKVTDTTDPNYGKYIWQNEDTHEAWYSATKGDASAPAGFTPVYNSRWVSVSEQKEADGVTPTEAATQTLADNGKTITQLKSYHNNRVVLVDVVYDVDPKQFRFSDKGRNTTAWYSMMTDNAQDGLMNFSYKDGIGARPDRTVHYTNNYLWAPEGDPYGFILHSRYATINGSGWDNVVVSTTSLLPTSKLVDQNLLRENQMVKVSFESTYYDDTETTASGDLATDIAIYTGQEAQVSFNQRRIVHPGRGETVNGQKRRSWSATNAVYEMYEGSYGNAFLMHPTAAYVNTTADKFSSFYMVHKPQTATTELEYSADVTDLRANKDANWHLITTPEQLLPYFDRSGYVGGLQPNVANRQQNRNYYARLQEFQTEWANNSRDLSQLPSDYFSVTDEIRELVYGGKFYARTNTGAYETTEFTYDMPRPKDADSYKLPLKFVPNNLVPMQQGYYRLEAFSRAALDHDAENVDGVGGKGIQGPRYISGYRFLSEKEKAGYSDGTLQDGSRWLHFFETDEANTTFNTFGELNSVIKSLDDNNHHERDIQPHPALRGNIDILPAEYDASSIFYFEPSSDAFDRYTWSTQGLRVRGRSGGVQSGDKYGTEIDVDANKYGRTKLVDASAISYHAGSYADEGDESTYGIFDDRFRLQDIGGTAVTLRLLKTEPNGTNWDEIVGENLKHGSLCIDANHRYRITIHDNNEMMEIGDTYDAATNHWSGYGIQDTKWLLKPVGTKTQWPYNEMPFRVEVHKGEQKSGTDSDGNPVYNYYASLYVPFDSRLNNTTDAAFTLDTEPKAVSSTEGNDGKQDITLRSLALLNNMGNPQFIPAEWPVIIRSSSPKTGTTQANSHGGSSGTERKYVDLYLPNNAPTVITDGRNKIVLKGSYLERSLTNEDGLNNLTGDANPIDTQKDVMVFGQPFKETGDNTTTLGAKTYYEHDDTQTPGFYTNENWWRGHYATSQVTETTNDGSLARAFLASLHGNDTATKQQRSNTYVYHNRVYLLYSVDTDKGPRYIPIHFEGDGSYDDAEEQEDEGESTEPTRKTPWPCDVYDLTGRKVATRETPQTLRQNHPGLPKGVYIFGHMKVMVQ